MVDDEDVERPERIARRPDDGRRRLDVGEVGLRERNAELACDTFGSARLGAPLLLRVVLGPALRENRGAAVE